MASQRWWCGDADPLLEINEDYLVLKSSQSLNHGGVPVGALLLHKTGLNSFCKLIKAHTGGRYFRKVDKLPNGRLLAHLTPELVIFIEEPDNKQVIESFMAESGARFFPGLCNTVFCLLCEEKFCETFTLYQNMSGY
jgi:hypothetical protein